MNYSFHYPFSNHSNLCGLENIFPTYGWGYLTKQNLKPWKVEIILSSSHSNERFKYSHKTSFYDAVLVHTHTQGVSGCITNVLTYNKSLWFFLCIFRSARKRVTNCSSLHTLHFPLKMLLLIVAFQSLLKSSSDSSNIKWTCPRNIISIISIGSYTWINLCYHDHTSYYSSVQKKNQGTENYGTCPTLHGKVWDKGIYSIFQTLIPLLYILPHVLGGLTIV